MLLAYPLWLALLAVALTIALFEVAAPDIDTVIGGRTMSPEARQRLLTQTGQELSFANSLFTQFSALMQFEFGRSWINGEPVLPVLAERTGTSLLLVAPGLLLGHWLAFLCATSLRSSRGLEALSALFVAAGWLLLAALVHALLATPSGLNVLPIMGFPPEFGFSTLEYLIAPTIVLTMGSFGWQYSYYRALFKEAKEASFVLADLALGARDEGRWVRRRALRGVLISRMLYALPTHGLAATLIIEHVFSIPGIGLRLFDAMLTGDRPVILAAVFLMAILLAGLRWLDQMQLRYSTRQALERSMGSFT